MKKLFYLFALNILCVYSLKAQYTLTASSMPVVGDVFTSFLADTTNVRAGVGGPSKTWDFSGLQISQNKSTTKYILPSATPYGSDFSSSSLAAESNLPIKNYVYMNSGTNDITINGTADTLYQTNYTLDQQKYITYPFSYDSTISDAFVGVFFFLGSNKARNGSWSLKADGYGTLVLPSGTYNNVLRLHSVQVHNDIFITTTTTSDSWYNNLSKFPLLSISKIVRTGNFSSISQYVSVNSDVVGIEEVNKNEVGLSLFPNPTSENAICRFILKKKTAIEISLFDMSGRNLKKLIKGNYESGINSENINLQGIPAGIYYLYFRNSENETGRIKIVKQ